MDLPDEVLAVVAAQLPPRERHSSFSLLCTRLKAAADHATRTEPTFTFIVHVDEWHKQRRLQREIDIQYYGDYDKEDYYYYGMDCCTREMRCDSFAGWLLKHGRHLTKLQLTNFNTALGDLPPGLRELELHGCSAEMHGSLTCAMRHTLSLRGLTSLTRLHSSCCAYSGKNLAQIAAVPSLKHLDFMCPLNPEPTDCHLGTHCQALPSDTFKQLSNLTHLSMRVISRFTSTVLLDIDGTGAGGNGGDGDNPAPYAAQHFSCLVKLQTLVIDTHFMSAQLAAGLEGLRCSEGLSRLELSCTRSYSVKADSSIRFGLTPWLRGLSSLQSLSLRNVYLDPNHLQGATQLAVLDLEHVAFSPTRLLGLLAHLTRLQRLCCRFDRPGELASPIPRPAGEDGGAAGSGAWASASWPPASPAYASLTASSQLQQLALVNCVLPAGAWQHAFPPGRQLPALHSLQAVGYDVNGRVENNATLNGADLMCIARACPNMLHICV